jgi:hypothetical protein
MIFESPKNNFDTSTADAQQPARVVAQIQDQRRHALLLQPFKRFAHIGFAGFNELVQFHVSNLSVQQRWNGRFGF